MGAHHPQLALTLLELADAHGNQGDIHQKIALLERAIDVQKRAFGDEHLKLVETYTSYSQAFGQLKEFAKQKQHITHAMNIARKRFGDQHIKTVGVLVHVAEANMNTGNIEAAKKQAQAAHDVMVEDLKIKEDHPAVIHSKQILQKLAEMTPA